MANLISLFRVVLAFYLLIMLGYETTPYFYWTAVLSYAFGNGPRSNAGSDFG